MDDLTPPHWGTTPHKPHSEGMERVRQGYIDAGWGKLALAAGFEPLNTEPAARDAFRWAYDNMIPRSNVRDLHAKWIRGDLTQEDFNIAEGKVHE